MINAKALIQFVLENAGKITEYDIIKKFGQFGKMFLDILWNWHKVFFDQYGYIIPENLRY